MKFRCPAALLALTATACLLLALAPAASASDGVILLTQATAARGLPNCPNDGQSLITICQSGSYRLAGNLTASRDGIDINANDVTLDLNGFRIAKIEGGNSAGVSSASDRVAVMHGTIIDFAAGVVLAGNSELARDLRIATSDASITLSSGVILDCTSTTLNGGVIVGKTSPVFGSMVRITNSVIAVFNPEEPAIEVDLGSTALVTGSIITAAKAIEADGRAVLGKNTLGGSATGSGLVSLKDNVCSDGSIC